MTTQTLFKNIGQIILPDAIRQVAQIALENPDRKAAQQKVIEQLPYPSERMRQALKEGAFGFFQLTRSEVVPNPFLCFVARAEASSAQDVLLYRFLEKYPIVRVTLEAMSDGFEYPKALNDEVARHLENPKGASHSVPKVFSSLRNFGLLSEGKNPQRLPYSPTLEGLGYVLHSEYSEKGSVTASLESIFDHPYLTLLGVNPGTLLSLLERGSVARYWALERSAVFNRVVFQHTLEGYVDEVLRRV